MAWWGKKKDKKQENNNSLSVNNKSSKNNQSKPKIENTFKNESFNTELNDAVSNFKEAIEKNKRYENQRKEAEMLYREHGKKNEG